MSAIAAFMADKGHRVSGSDREATAPLFRMLNAKGIEILPQDGSGIDESFDFIVFSTAVEPDNPDYRKAQSLGIPIKMRPDYLAEIIASYKTIAVSGTSGKSTTAGLIAFLMQRLGLGPNFIGGGRVKQLRTHSNPGNSLSGGSDYLIAEACESDGSIVNYKPLHALLLNLQLDHHPVEETYSMFEELLRNSGGVAVINADDDNLKGITRGDMLTFSIDGHSDLRAADIAYGNFGSGFSVCGRRFALALPGRHNIYNALAAIAALKLIGVPPEDIAPLLAEFGGIERRFDIHLNDGRRLVIDDYAHNPHKIAALMQTVSEISESVCYVFQPHGYGPTRLMRRQYIEVFAKHLRDADCLILLPIYYAGGTAQKDISSADLAGELIAAGRRAEAVADRKEALGRLKGGASIVVMGARDESLSVFAKEIAASL